MAFWSKQTKPKETRNEEKKLGLIRRTWKKIRNVDWKNPVNRWKLLFVSFFSFLALLGVSFGAIEATNNPAFCKSCHEMGPEHITFEASAHSEISCVQCHVKPGAVNEVLHKVESLKEVYYHVVGPPDPIAQTVAVENENCEQCHSENRLVSATGDLKVNHKKHIDEDIPCITCHSGVAHAKVVERGLNTQDVLDKWKPEVADKLMGKEYMAPNMGTCIDCHNQVNQGKKPWEDIAYSLPESNHGKKDDHKAEASEEADKASHKKTQDVIFQAIGKQLPDAKLSMECSSCHLKINTPKNHDNLDWDQGHGEFALGSLDKCINCHTDSKWIKEYEKQDINQLLKKTTGKEKYTKNIEIVKTEARKNQFCSTCHTDRPASHGESDAWLTQHSGKAKTTEEKTNCTVCHDLKKAEEGQITNAPTDVYCEFCHRTGFKK